MDSIAREAVRKIIHTMANDGTYRYPFASSAEDIVLRIEDVTKLRDKQQKILNELQETLALKSLMKDYDLQVYCWMIMHKEASGNLLAITTNMLRKQRNAKFQQARELKRRLTKWKTTI